MLHMLHTLHRHQLVSLSPAAWAGVRAQAWDAQAQDILAHWQAHGLPLVVARQSPEHAGAGLLALGLPAPALWQRRRIALNVALNMALNGTSSGLAGCREFPGIDEVLALAASPEALQTMRQLQQGLQQAGVPSFVFGSHGWQALTGLAYLRPGSDLDLWLPVAHATQADQVAALLRALPQQGLRVDAELMFAGGAAVAWREWDAWRAGRTRSVLVKRLHGVALEEDRHWWEGAVR